MRPEAPTLVTHIFTLFGAFSTKIVLHATTVSPGKKNTVYKAVYVRSKGTYRYYL